MVRSVAYWGEMPRLPANGGATQFNLSGPDVFALYADYMKSSSAWTYIGTPTDPDNSQGTAVAELDVNGYATELVAGVTGIFCYLSVPDINGYAGNLLLKWRGVGVVSINGQYELAPGETQDFSAIESLTDAGGRFLFRRTAGSILNPLTSFAITEIGSTPGEHIREVVICREEDEEYIDNGGIWHPDTKADMQYVRIGALRFLGTIGQESNGTNVCNMGLWEHRKPSTYRSWASDEFRADYWAGAGSWTGNVYTVPGYTGFNWADKSILHLTFVGEPGWGSAQQQLYTASFNPATNVVSWMDNSGSPTNHNLIVGDPVTFGNAESRGTCPAGITPAQIYWVESIPTAQTLTLSTTRGGAVHDFAGTSTDVIASSMYMLRVEEDLSKIVQFTFQYRNVGKGYFIGYFKPTPGGVATMAYDETTGVLDWCGCGGNPFSSGITSGCPPEILLQMCIDIGTQPHITLPMLTCDLASSPHGVTDFITSYAAMCKARQDSDAPWLRPIIEGPNETWNDATAAFRNAFHAQAVAYARWGYNDLYYAAHTYGMWMSKIGQALDTAFGSDRSKYICAMGFQTVGFFGTPSYVALDWRMKSEMYVDEEAGEPANEWTTHG
jgi:hypothetical protein